MRHAVVEIGGKFSGGIRAPGVWLLSLGPLDGNLVPWHVQDSVYTSPLQQPAQESPFLIVLELELGNLQT